MMSSPVPGDADAGALETGDLLSARDAVQQLAPGHLSTRTAQQRAQRASARGDCEVQKVGMSWVAPGWWWRRLLEPPAVRGRPRSQGGDTRIQLPRELRDRLAKVARKHRRSLSSEVIDALERWARENEQQQ